MAEERATHTMEMERKAHDEKLRKQEADFQTQLKQRQMEAQFQASITKSSDQQKQSHRQELNKIQLQYLASLNKDMNVDITKYLSAQYQQADKIVKIVAEDKKPNPTIHVHEK
jgi:hypothetical protein